MNGFSANTNLLARMLNLIVCKFAVCIRASSIVRIALGLGFLQVPYPFFRGVFIASLTSLTDEDGCLCIASCSPLRSISVLVRVAFCVDPLASGRIVYHLIIL